MRRRAEVVRASEKECRNRRRHEEESRSIVRGSEEECRNRRRHAEESRSSKGK